MLQNIKKKCNHSGNEWVGQSVRPSVPFVVSQSVSQCVNQSVSQTIKQTVSLSASQSISVSQPASQSVNQTVSQSIIHRQTPVFRRLGKAIHLINRCAGKPCYPLDSDLCGGYWSVSRSVGRSVSWPASQTVRQSVSQTDTPSVGQTVGADTNQSGTFIRETSVTNCLPCASLLLNWASISPLAGMTSDSKLVPIPEAIFSRNFFFSSRLVFL